MGESKSVFNLGDLSKPANTLVKCIANATSAIFLPYQIRRVAQAEADAQRIRTLSQIETTDFTLTALRRFVSEQVAAQINIETITQKAIPLVTESAAPQEVEKDWIVHFFDRCRLISDDDMQNLWAKVLAGEANTPGRFSKRTVNILSEISKADADMFTRLCAFVWTINGERIPIVVTNVPDFYLTNGMPRDDLLHLDSIGLVQFASQLGHFLRRLKTPVSASYFGTLVSICLLEPGRDSLNVGHVRFTAAGRELESLCHPQPIDGFVDFVRASQRPFNSGTAWSLA